MSALQERFWDDIEDLGRASSVRLRETHFGFAFGAPYRKWGVEALAEGALKSFALTIMIASSLLWFVPLSQFSMGGAGRSAITAMSMLLGYGVFRYANLGFVTEYHVDAGKRELRVATRNTNDEIAVRRTFAMRNIQSGFIRRYEDRRRAAQLNIRLQGKSAPVPLLSGAEADLLPVLERLMHEVRQRGPEPRKPAGLKTPRTPT